MRTPLQSSLADIRSSLRPHSQAGSLISWHETLGCLLLCARDGLRRLIICCRLFRRIDKPLTACYHLGIEGIGGVPMKRLLCLMMTIVLLMPCCVGFAATLVNGGYSAGSGDPLSGVKTFKFEHKYSGIGKGTCPVYTAPYEGAYRGANGKACVDTNHSLDIGGYSNNGWLLVRYETNSGSNRVGWIPPKYIKGVKTAMSPHFSYIAQVAQSSIYVTDDNLSPYNPKSYFAQLQPGETYYVIGRYNYYQYDLWYIEFFIGNQAARGFIPVS